MNWKKYHYIIRVLITILYFSNAFSPSYVAIPAGGLSGEQQPIYGKVAVGSVWLNVFLDGMIEEDETENTAAGAQSFQPSQEESDYVLLKRKRFVFRQIMVVQPLLQVCFLAPDDVRTVAQGVVSLDVPQDLIHRHMDGFYSRSTGLSPPRSLS